MVLKVSCLAEFPSQFSGRLQNATSGFRLENHWTPLRLTFRPDFRPWFLLSFENTRQILREWDLQRKIYTHLYQISKEKKLPELMITYDTMRRSYFLTGKLQTSHRFWFWFPVSLQSLLLSLYCHFIILIIFYTFLIIFLNFFFQVLANIHNTNKPLYLTSSSHIYVSLLVNPS